MATGQTPYVASWSTHPRHDNEMPLNLEAHRAADDHLPEA